MKKPVRDRRPFSPRTGLPGAEATEGKVLRQALFTLAFNHATRDSDPPPEIAAVLEWAERASLPVASCGPWSLSATRHQTWRASLLRNASE